MALEYAQKRRTKALLKMFDSIIFKFNQLFWSFIQVSSLFSDFIWFFMIPIIVHILLARERTYI